MYFRLILCAVDFSPPSREALQCAVELAVRYGARLVLLHVYGVPGYAVPEGVMVSTPQVLEQIEKDTRRELVAWQEEAKASGAAVVDVDTAIGSPAEEIVRAAKSGGFDLIVVGTHGRTGIRHVLLGSVAERVVRTATCPVLTVHSREHRAAEGESVR